jgi:hypothetical protein
VAAHSKSDRKARWGWEVRGALGGVRTGVMGKWGLQGRLRRMEKEEGGGVVDARGGGAWPGHCPRHGERERCIVWEQGRGGDRHVGHGVGGCWASCYGLSPVNSAFSELNRIVSKGLELIRYKDSLLMLNIFQINMVVKDLNKRTTFSIGTSLDSK